jgi:hypothetical protein
MEGRLNSMRRAYLAKTGRGSMEMGADPCGSKPFLRFVTPSDVRDLKNRVDPFVVSTDASVAACAGLPAGVAAGWSEFSKKWRDFYNEDESWFHTAAQMDQAEAYECDLLHWQQTIQANKCATGAPLITPEDAGGAAGGAQWAGTIKVVAIAGAVVAVALGLRAVMK